MMIGFGRPRLFSRGAWLTVAAMLAIAAAGCQSGGKSSAKSETVDPGAFIKQQGLAGCVVMVQFGVVGCPLSENGLGKMAALRTSKELGAVAFLRVEAGERSQARADYFAAKAPGFPVYYDGDHAVSRGFDATAWPTYVLVDKFGHVRYRGSWPEDEKLADWVAALGTETTDPGLRAAMFGATALDVLKLLDETRLPDLQGDVKPLRGRMGGKGLVLVFVDTTCPFSAAVIGEISNVAAVLGQHEVPCVLVNLDDAKGAVLPFYEGHKVGLPVVYDATTVTKNRWQVSSVPTVVFLSADGRMGYCGKAVWQDLAMATEAALKLTPGTIKFSTAGTAYG